MTYCTKGSPSQRLFVWLAGAVGRQSALHKENSGFVTATLCWHISTFRSYRILFSIWNPSPIIFLFIHNHLTLRKWCYTPLQHDFALDPMISSFHFHFNFFFKHLSRDFEKTTITAMYPGRWFAYKQTKQTNTYFYCQS